MTISTVRRAAWVHRMTAAVVGAGLLSTILAACSSSTGSDHDPCFRGQKSETNDVRILIFNSSGTTGVRVVVNGPGGQTQACEPVNTDFGSPTNVVMNVAVGQTVNFTFLKDGSSLGTGTCTLTQSAFVQPDMGTPGNADVSFSVNGAGTSATLTCGFGFQ